MVAGGRLFFRNLSECSQATCRNIGHIVQAVVEEATADEFYSYSALLELLQKSAIDQFPPSKPENPENLSRSIYIALPPRLKAPPPN